MRLTLTAVALVALCAPASVLASTDMTTTAIQTSTTTITKTLMQANATTTMYMSSSSANWTSASATLGPTSVIPMSTFRSAASSGNSLGNGAGSEQINLSILGLAGAAALIFGSL